MNIYIILIILFLHWIADFVLQTKDQAQNKSSSWRALTDHTSYYSLVFIAASIFYAIFVSPNVIGCKMIMFGFITWPIHTAIDYYTSRVNKELWGSLKFHEFFVSVGFDQFLHIAQLLLTYKLLM